MYDIIVENEEILQETNKLIQKIACSKIKRQFKSKSGNMTASFYIDKDDVECPKLISNLNHLYHDHGIGFKLLSKQLDNVSYTRLRTIFSELGITKRDGNSCVTETLKTIRSKNAQKSTNPWRDWSGKSRNKDGHHKHHLCGWYFNRSKSKYVWLRSSWEYAYAKWLDDQSIAWDVECRSYLLSDGRYYRPDFFIYQNNALKKIVEIKAKWYNGSLERIEKFEQFKKEYSDIEAELFTSVELQSLGIDLQSSLKAWKKERVLEKKDYE